MIDIVAWIKAQYWSRRDHRAASAGTADAGLPVILNSVGKLGSTLLGAMAAATVKGRALGAGTGDPTDLTAAQVNAIVATAALTMLNDLVMQGAISVTIKDASAVTKAIIAQASVNDALVPGSLAGDLVIRAQTQKIILSADGGTTPNATLTTSGTFALQATQPFLTFVNASAVTKVFFGIVSAINNIITGTAVGDLALRTVTQDILISADNGATAHLKIATTGNVSTSASTSTAAPFRIPHGTAPSSPVNGDIWTTTAGLYVHINGATVGPLS